MVVALKRMTDFLNTHLHSKLASILVGSNKNANAKRNADATSLFLLFLFLPIFVSKDTRRFTNIIRVLTTCLHVYVSIHSSSSSFTGPVFFHFFAFFVFCCACSSYLRLLSLPFIFSVPIRIFLYESSET